MQNETTRNYFPASYLGLMGFLAALVMASDAGAGALFSLPTNFPAGDSPSSVAVADLDGDTVPDLVTANYVSGDVSVLLGNGDGSFQTVPIRGPGLAMNLRAGTVFPGGYFLLALDIRADEAGRLEPIGTRMPLFREYRYFTSYSGANYGTFIVGREILNSVPALLPGARVVLALVLGLSVPCWYALGRRWST